MCRCLACLLLKDITPGSGCVSLSYRTLISNSPRGNKTIKDLWFFSFVSGADKSLSSQLATNKESLPKGFLIACPRANGSLLVLLWGIQVGICGFSYGGVAYALKDIQDKIYGWSVSSPYVLAKPSTYPVLQRHLTSYLRPPVILKLEGLCSPPQS